MLEGRCLFFYAVFDGGFSTLFGGDMGRAVFQGVGPSGAGDHQLFFFVWPYSNVYIKGSPCRLSRVMTS